MICPQAKLRYTRATVAVILQACSCFLLELIVLFCHFNLQGSQVWAVDHHTARALFM